MQDTLDSGILTDDGMISDDQFLNSRGDVQEDKVDEQEVEQQYTNFIKG